MTAETDRPKLSCRNLWKVFGDGPIGPLPRPGAEGEAAEALAKMRAKGQLPAVIDVSFDVAEGEIFVIMGLSGSGKSTLVRCVARLVEPTAGQVLIDGDDLLAAPRKRLVEFRRHQMGMVFQNFGLLPHLSVIENVAFPLRVQGVPLQERMMRAQEVVALVGLEGRERAYPWQLSGGQQQRVGIARSLAVGPALWFLDEPFSALDPLIRRQMQNEFLRLQRLLKKTIVFITHDFLEALRIADRIAIMKDGRIVQVGTPAEVVLSPANEYVANFVSDVPLVRVLTARDVMEPLGGVPADRTRADGAPADRAPTRAESLPGSTTVESLLSRLARSDMIAVTGDDGAALGRVTRVGLLHALAEAESGVSTRLEDSA